jgi:hypothetical protein
MLGRLIGILVLTVPVSIADAALPPSAPTYGALRAVERPAQGRHPISSVNGRAFPLNALPAQKRFA